MARFRKSAATSTHRFRGQHRFEHWYRDNTVYFLTARCRDRFPSFATEQAKLIFWDRFNHYTDEAGFTPIVTSLIDNHYHCLGYLKRGENLGQMMRKLHGAVAKLVNDTLANRQKPFWREKGHRDYFDGCIRDEKQCRLAFRYTLTQSVRHGIVADWRTYAHTVVNVPLESAVKRALELGAFMEGVPYARYERERRDRG